MGKLNQRIFLIGMMGAGKSFRAQKLSAHFDIPWFDTDVMIEQEAGKTIREIFAEEGGEERFRLMEYHLLINYPWPRGCIVSCGGGMPCYHGNMDIMLGLGLVVWLSPDIDLLTERLWKETSHRPMVVNSGSREALKTTLKKLFRTRETFYRKADLEITGNPDPQKFIETILQAIA